MKRNKTIDPISLLEEARKSEHRESYMLLERKKNYRVGVGAEIASSNQPSFFFEILIYLSPESDHVDLPLLERAIVLLKELKGRGYLLSFQDCNCISCQKTVTPEELVAKYEDIESMMKRVYQ